MQEATDQTISIMMREELHRLFDTFAEVPYSALPSERPEVICFARRVEALSGYSADKILADKQLWINMIYPTDCERVFAAYSRCKEKGTGFKIEYRVIHKDGSVRCVVDEGEPVFDDKGQITRIEGIITAVCERGRAEDKRLSEVSQVTRFNRVNTSVFQNV